MPTELTPTQENSNQLWFACQNDQGNIAITLMDAKPDTIEMFRTRDRFILREMAKSLPKITEVDEACANSLFQIAKHLNTYEGFIAAIDMLSETYPLHSVLFNNLKNEVEEKYKDRWSAKLSIKPIQKNEYSPDANIPTERPLPARDTSIPFY